MKLHSVLLAALMSTIISAEDTQGDDNASDVGTSNVSADDVGTGSGLSAADWASTSTSALTVSKNLMNYNPQHGRFTQLEVWYWWIGGAAWDTYLSFGAFTNDTRYLPKTIGFLNENVGPAFDFVVLNNSASEASDDQAFWAFAALSGLELGVNSTGIKCPANKPQCHPFFDLANNTYTDFISRWNKANSTCRGGLPWGFQPNPGQPSQLTYKNTVTNGGFFQIAARLARYTGEQHYADWATKIWDWMEETGLITLDYSVYDGADSKTNCNSLDKDEWTYLNAVVVYGAAIMADITGNSTWSDRTTGLVDAAIKKFTKPVTSAPNVLFEANRDCERLGKCNVDQKTFKGYLARYLGRTASLRPELKDRIKSVLQASSTAAGKTCTGGESKTNCGAQWYTGSFNGVVGPSQDLAVFDVFTANLGIDYPPMRAADAN